MARRNNDTGKMIEGIFSTPGKAGEGKAYWLVREIPGGRAEVQKVNDRLVPSGPRQVITLGRLLEAYEPEPDFYVAKSRQERTPEKSPAQKKSPSEKQPGVALDLEGFDLHGAPEEVEKNARAGFGMGLAHLKRGNLRRAREIFDSLAGADADFAPEHKHMLNDFGITLRKQGLPESSIKNYDRALSLTREDENLHFNVARSFYDLGQFNRAAEHLEKALELEPGFMEARMFMQYIRRKGHKASSHVKLDAEGD